MKLNKYFFVFLFTEITLLAVYSISKSILSKYGLVYRNIINYSAYAALAVISLSLAAMLGSYLFCQSRSKQIKTAIRVFSGLGIVAIIAIIAFTSLNIFIRSVFGHQPEHVVEKDGRMMVARVDSFLQVEVRYYNHVNSFVRGSKTLIHEDYGNGGYNPFERDDMPEVQRYIYYDERGKITKSKWFDGYDTP